jgi:mycothiol synthase
VSAPDARIRVASHLTHEEILAALALADDSARIDGAYPLSEHVVLHLRHGGSDSVHLLAEQQGTPGLLGYAHLDLSEAAEGPAAELAVSPSARRQGLGGMLVDELVRQAEAHPGRLRLWAHGADAAANELAAAHGFHRVRRLWQLRRSLFAPMDPVALPPGITLRSFDAERDVDDWLALNAAAFTDLPDQGSWSREDLEQRMAEPWFDPDGFLIAEAEDGRLAGFHWTKVHSHGHGHPHLDDTPHGHPHLDDTSGPHTHAHAGDGPAPAGHAHEPIGEVYVVGVDPGMRGRGLGRSLTLAGLHHLRHLGLSAALLYVDADNEAAISLYRALGFAPWDSDTLFRR